MYKLIFIVVLGQLSTSTITAQDTPKYRNMLTFSPLRLLDPIHSGVEAGYERAHSEKYSTQLFWAYLYSGTFNKVYDDYKGYRLGIEEKYFIRREGRSRKYFSCEMIYQSNRFSSMNLFVHDSSNTSSYFEYPDSIKINRKLIIFNVKSGRQIIIKRFVTDISFGAGLRFRNIKHEDKLYPGDRFMRARHYNLHENANSEKHDVAFNIPLNIRLGFRF